METVKLQVALHWDDLVIDDIIRVSDSQFLRDEPLGPGLTLHIWGIDFWCKSAGEYALCANVPKVSSASFVVTRAGESFTFEMKHPRLVRLPYGTYLDEDPIYSYRVEYEGEPNPLDRCLENLNYEEIWK